MAEYAVVKDNHLSFNGKNYFRGGSEDVELGSYGEKKSPITQTNYLEVQGKIPTAKLKVKEAVEVTIDFEDIGEGAPGQYQCRWCVQRVRQDRLPGPEISKAEVG
jgi:hypothetical protein